MARIAALFLICLLYSNPLWSADDAHQSAPIYDPASKSYFQLFDDNLKGHWVEAKALAATKFYNGVRGRLAVVDSAEKNQFILKNFGLNWRDASVWIGLRYWCPVRMLQWEGSLPYSPSDANHFALWHNPWSRPEGGLTNPCGMAASVREGYAPVYYRNIGGSVRWQAVGAGKGFTAYLVEYVTHGE